MEKLDLNHAPLSLAVLEKVVELIIVFGDLIIVNPARTGNAEVLEQLALVRGLLSTGSAQ